MFTRFITVSLVALSLAALLAGCGDDATGDDLSSRKINVVATTGMIADAAANVGGERVEVEGLMGPGIDPHLYKASAGDVNKLEKADIILYNGLELEGRMTDIFVRLASSKPTVAVTEGISPDSLREPPEFAGKYDPHVWFDVTLWIEVVRAIESHLSELDPDHADEYTENANAYIAELESLDSWVQEQVNTIPEEARVLITAHDAFGYFGDTYGLEVLGLQGISTQAEAGLADVRDLADYIANNNIPAVFIESSVSESTINAVRQAVQAKGKEVSIGGTLFSDAMGEAGTEEGTYIGMVRHNVNTIVGALSGQ